MRDKLREFVLGPWAGRITLILVILIVLLSTVLVQITKDTNAFALWVFIFVGDWAVPLSAAAAVAIAAMALRTFRENRIATARLEVRGWARESLESLTVVSEQQTPTQERENLEKRLRNIRAASVVALSSARPLGSDQQQGVEEVIVDLFVSLSLITQSKEPAVTPEMAGSVSRLKGSLGQVIEATS